MRSMTIADTLRHIQDSRARKEKERLFEEAYSRPVKTDTAEVSIIYECFKKECDPKCRDNAKIFVLIIYYLYRPEKLISGRMPRGKLRGELAMALGVTTSAVSHLFADARSLFRHHKGFRDEAERVFAIMQDKLSPTTTSHDKHSERQQARHPHLRAIFL